MSKPKINLNKEVTQFLDNLNHPLRTEIEQLRQYILSANNGLIENIKWNGPNYCFNQEDRITMKIQPPKQIQLIFHRGAKVKEQPTNKLIEDHSGLLTWRGNDRAIATFKNKAHMEDNKQNLTLIINNWIEANRT